MKEPMKEPRYTERPDAVADAQLDASRICRDVAWALERQPTELRAIWLVAFADQMLMRLRHLGYEDVVDEASGLTEMDVYGYPGGSKAEFIAGDPGYFQASRTEQEKA
jgi:hypothetical protein